MPCDLAPLPQQLTLTGVAGLNEALELLTDIADQHKDVSYADLFQFASGVAVEVRHGRAFGWSIACHPEPCNDA